MRSHIYYIPHLLRMTVEVGMLRDDQVGALSSIYGMSLRCIFCLHPFLPSLPKTAVFGNTVSLGVKLISYPYIFTSVTNVTIIGLRLVFW